MQIIIKHVATDGSPTVCLPVANMFSVWSSARCSNSNFSFFFSSFIQKKKKLLMRTHTFVLPLRCQDSLIKKTKYSRGLATMEEKLHSGVQQLQPCTDMAHKIFYFYDIHDCKLDSLLIYRVCCCAPRCPSVSISGSAFFFFPFQRFHLAFNSAIT